MAKHRKIEFLMGTAREHGVERLYHYQCGRLDYVETALRENRIRCSNPENFNDPWDCRPYFDTASVNDPSKRHKWIEFIKKQFDGFTEKQQDNILAQLGPQWYENTEFLIQSVEKTMRSVHRNNADRYRIFC